MSIKGSKLDHVSKIGPRLKKTWILGMNIIRIETVMMHFKRILWYHTYTTPCLYAHFISDDSGSTPDTHSGVLCYSTYCSLWCILNSVMINTLWRAQIYQTMTFIRHCVIHQYGVCHWSGCTDYCDIIMGWARWCLKSPDSRLFTQPFIEAQIKENIKAPLHWPLYREFTGDRVIPA